MGGGDGGGKDKANCGGVGFGLAVVEDHMGDTYRAVYTVKIADKVYVLHCFQNSHTLCDIMSRDLE